MPDTQKRYPDINRPVYMVNKAFFTMLMNTVSRLRIINKESLPPKGPYIVATNHLSFLDSPYFLLALKDYMRAFAAAKYKKHLFHFLLDIGGPIYIKRGEIDRDALRQALNVLEDGLVMAIAIEGTRSKTGGLIEGKVGTAYLANKANVPVYPLAIYGSEKVLPGLKRLRREKVFMQYGEPLYPPEGRARTEQLQAFTDEIMLSLASMLPEQYRGIYADHPLLRDKLARTRQPEEHLSAAAD